MVISSSPCGIAELCEQVMMLKNARELRIVTERVKRRVRSSILIVTLLNRNEFNRYQIHFTVDRAFSFCAQTQKRPPAWRPCELVTVPSSAGLPARHRCSWIRSK